MHNFGVPSVLKLWIDQIARVGRTFSYGEGGPKGLISGKKATFIIATGGIYDAQTQMASFNFVEPYLRSVFGFLGVKDTTFLTAGGTSALNQGQDRNAFPCRRTRRPSREDTHENYFNCRSLSTGPYVYGLWVEWISQLYPSAATH
jgi:FMN-dependent NADH-azoreductase